MIVHALQKGDYDVDKMIAALEGYKFLAPKGFQAIRPQDHAMLQPMFRVALVPEERQASSANVLGTASPYDTAPPIVAMRGLDQTSGRLLARERISDPRNTEPRARHRRRDNRRRCRARGRARASCSP